MTEESDHKRNLMRERDYLSERLPEVMMERHDDEHLKRFEDAVTAMPEVLECWLVTGEYDYMLKAAVGGTAGYEKLLREKIYRLPGVRHTRTAFTLRCLKRVLSPVP